MSDLYIGINKGVSVNGTGSQNGPILSSSSISADLLLKLVGTAFTSGQDRQAVLVLLEQVKNQIEQTGSWPLS